LLKEELVEHQVLPELKERMEHQELQVLKELMGLQVLLEFPQPMLVLLTHTYPLLDKQLSL
jgi:hypothetical protein